MARIFLGQTNLPECRLGLGLAALGRPGYINIGHQQDLEKNYAVKAMEANTWQVLDAAYQSGIRYFDAARSYGKAEAFLSSWLSSREIFPDQCLVGSKWGYRYTANWQVDAEVHEIKEHSLSNLRQQWQESKDLLGPYLDLYQIHSATLETGVLENTAVLTELAAVRAAGTAVGVTVSGPRQEDIIRLALAVELDGERLFDSIQATWNLLEKSAGDALIEANQAGLRIILKEVLANGRLTARNQNPAFQTARSLLSAEADRHQTTLDGLAIAAVLAQPWVDIALSGAARKDHLTSNLKALDVSWDEETEQRLSVLVEKPEVYWTTRSGLDWN